MVVNLSEIQGSWKMIIMLTLLRGLDWGVHIASTSVNRRFICYPIIMSQRIFKDSCDLPSVSPFSLYPAYSTLGKWAFLILSKHICCPRAWRTLSRQFLLFGILCLLTVLSLLYSILSSNTNTIGWLDTCWKCYSWCFLSYTSLSCFFITNLFYLTFLYCYTFWFVCFPW